MRGADIRAELTIATGLLRRDFQNAWEQIMNIHRRAYAEGVMDAVRGLQSLPLLFAGVPELSREWYEANIAYRSTSKMCGRDELPRLVEGEQLATEGAKDFALACRIHYESIFDTEAARHIAEELASNLEKLAHLKLSTVSCERAKELRDAAMEAPLDDGEQVYCLKSFYAEKRAASLANAELRLATCEHKIAVEGAKELVSAFHSSLCAEYADDFGTRSTEREGARGFANRAYMKLATVDAKLANELVMAARERHRNDGQLYDSIVFSEKLYQDAVHACINVRGITNSLT